MLYQYKVNACLFRRIMSLFHGGVVVLAAGCGSQDVTDGPEDVGAVLAEEVEVQNQPPAFAEPEPVTAPSAAVSGAIADPFANAIVDEVTPSGLAATTVDAQPRLFEIPAETPVVVNLIDRIGTSLNRPGDMFLASLAEPVDVDGSRVLDPGVLLRGRIVEVSRPGRLQGRARISMVLTHIERGSDAIDIQTLPFTEEAEQNLGRDATLGGLGAAAGAAIGAAAGGVGTVAVTRGDELEYPAETRIEFQLELPVAVPRIEVAMDESSQLSN